MYDNWNELIQHEADVFAADVQRDEKQPMARCNECGGMAIVTDIEEYGCCYSCAFQHAWDNA
jgi:hypothetical protein